MIDSKKIMVLVIIFGISVFIIIQLINTHFDDRRIRQDYKINGTK